MGKKELICIGCPMGCSMTVELGNDGAVTSVSGNTCKRGDIYARKEVTNPTRIVTSTVLLRDGVRERVPVKTRADVPKRDIFRVMREINRAAAQAPVRIGDVILRNVAGTGVDVVATANVGER